MVTTMQEGLLPPFKLQILGLESDRIARRGIGYECYSG